jgi:hypothetical protein
MNGNDVEVTVCIWIPWARGGGKEYAYREILDRVLAEDLLCPLPRDREIDPRQQRQTYELLEKRRRITDRISTYIAAALVHTISEQDTVDGYSKEELIRGK